MPEFRRKKIRLPRTSYLGPQWYFLTACTQERRPRFQDAGLVAEIQSLLAAQAHTARLAIEAYASCLTTYACWSVGKEKPRIASDS